jgi:hypothetical protein
MMALPGPPPSWPFPPAVGSREASSAQDYRPVLGECKSSAAPHHLDGVAAREGAAAGGHLFGTDDQATWSPVGSPTRLSPPLITWTEWLRARGLRLEDVRPQRRRRPQATPPSGQMAFTWGG